MLVQKLALLTSGIHSNFAPPEVTNIYTKSYVLVPDPNIEYHPGSLA